MKIGYARVSKDNQNLDRQLDLLNEFGVERIISEKISGTKDKRTGLEQLFQVLRPNDSVVVESISRLGRNTLDILKLIQRFDEASVQFISLKESMDTSTPTGKAMFQMMSVIAELERNLLAERVKEGVASSRRRGVKVGRPKIPHETLDVALRMYDSSNFSIQEIVKQANISQGTLYRAINKRKLNEIDQKN